MTLITGHKGFIGSRLYENGDVGIDFRDGLNLLTCELPGGVDVIYHLAAQTSVEASWGDPVHDADNLRMVVRLCKEYPNARIIYANSAAALDPISSPYGFSKWAGAEYLKKFHKDYVICTFPNVYGPGSKSVVDIFKNSSECVIYGDGSHTRDYVHVDDIVLGLDCAYFWPTGEYQMGSGISTAVIDLVHGKPILYANARKEAKESVLRNDTPDWNPMINVHEYLDS